MLYESIHVWQYYFSRISILVLSIIKVLRLITLWRKSLDNKYLSFFSIFNVICRFGCWLNYHMHSCILEATVHSKRKKKIDKRGSHIFSNNLRKLELPSKVIVVVFIIGTKKQAIFVNIWTKKQAIRIWISRRNTEDCFIEMGHLITRAALWLEWSERGKLQHVC